MIIKFELIDHWSKVYTQDCPEPCSTMTIALGFPIYDNFTEANKGRVKMYFKSRISEKRNVVPYDEITLFAEIGGYMGALLGCSMIHIFEAILTFLMDLLWYSL